MEKIIREIVSFALAKTQDTAPAARAEILEESGVRLWQEADKASEEEYFSQSTENDN